MHLVNDILAYTSISFNKEFRMIYENIDIRKTVEEVTNMMQIRIKMRKIKLITEIDKDIPHVFCTEPRRLKQILINLISNAVKFTFKGFIKIKI